jgi:membrane fusion protein (multidrug efflux system)
LKAPNRNRPRDGRLRGPAARRAALTACDAKKAATAPPPPTVLVAPAARRDVALYIEAVASLDGYVNADIRARVKGYLKTQSYKDGSPVKSGQLLFTIEPADYAAAVSVARAAVTRARVAQAHNKVQLERDQGLIKTGMLSQQDLDNATANLADTDGQLQAAQAQLDQAALNLSYTQVSSPIDGVAGLALVRVGNLVGQDGPTLLTTVSQLDPIRVNFPMSESDYIRYRDRLSHLEQRDLAWAKKQFAKLESGGVTDDGDTGVELVLADGSTYPHRGVIVTANRQIDASTGTIQIQALAAEPRRGAAPGRLRAGAHQAARGGPRRARRPEKALISVQGTYSVGVVGPDNKVTLRRVEVGPSVSGIRVVTSGIAEGDRIVVDGVQKISDGALVDPKPAPPPGSGVRGGAGRERRAGTEELRRRKPPVSNFFIRRPIVAMVIAILTVLLGGRVAARAADRAVSADPAAAGQPDDDVHGRRRAHDRAVGRDADRAADERRRAVALHPVDQRQRRLDEPGGDVRRRHRPRRRQRPRQQPLLAGAAVLAAGREELRRHDQEVARVPAHGRLAVLARRPLRLRRSSRTTRSSTSTTRSCA